jgi:hypothetical protein
MSSSTGSVPTQKDLDCASLARDAVFPLKVQRDGSHPQQFPASEAVARVRDAAMEYHSDRADSSFFPRGIVVVHDVNDQTLQWNGQPDINNADASVSIIPKLLSVRCQMCGDGREAFVRRKANDQQEREIVLCTDKLLKKDYSPSKFSQGETTPAQSLVAVETALAHHVTKIGVQVEKELQEPPGSITSKSNTTTTTSCPDLAAMEVLAARAAECYYSQTKGVWGQKAAEIKCGPALGHPGYSLYPQFIQSMLQDKCVRAVAIDATAREYKKAQARTCVNQAMAKK